MFTYHIQTDFNNRLKKVDDFEKTYDILFKKQQQILEKLKLEYFPFYNYAHHIFSTTGNLLLIRVMGTNEQIKELEKRLKKNKLKYKKINEKFTDEIAMHCLASQFVDKIKHRLNKDNVGHFLHLMCNNLGFKDEIKLFML